jgi:hypothetical protein
MSEEQAKQKWVVAEVSKIADLTEKCEEGDSAACDTLSKEDEAKKAWLAKQDVPSWGKMSEEQAKQKWLAQREPAWGKAASAMIEVVAEAGKMADLTEKCEAGESAACDTLSKEDEAKKAWFARLDVPSWGKMTEKQGKVAGGDDPVTLPVTLTSEAEVLRLISKWGNHNAQESPAPKTSEEEAKQKWLAQRETVW